MFEFDVMGNSESGGPSLTVVLSDAMLMLTCSHTCGFQTMKPRALLEIFGGIWDIENNSISKIAVTERQFWNALQPFIHEEIPVKVEALLSTIFHACTSKLRTNVKCAASLVELLCIMSIFCDGPKSQKLAFTFAIFDGDEDGILQEEEFIFMLSTILKGISLMTAWGQKQDPEELSSWAQLASEATLKVQQTLTYHCDACHSSFHFLLCTLPRLGIM